MHALVRQPPLEIAKCVSSHSESSSLDPELAIAQWSKYVEALETVCTVIRLPSLPEYPDSCFVEDTAVIHENKALITIPGHPTRRGETKSIKKALEAQGLEIIEMTSGALDGGDVLNTGRHIFVGKSKRTNDEGIEWLKKLGLPVIPVPGVDVLHLKCLVTNIGNTLIVYDVFEFPEAQGLGYDIVRISGLISANVLDIPDSDLVLIQNIKPYAEELKQICKRLGKRVIELEMSEIIKADGALTCQSLLFKK